MNSTIFTSVIVKIVLFYFGHRRYSAIVTIAGAKRVLFIYYGESKNSTMFLLWWSSCQEVGKSIPEALPPTSSKPFTERTSVKDTIESTTCS
jgi:hypothetical protein